MRGRLAPSPTGPLHLGNARTALVAWLSVRSRAGVLVYRVEDLDPPRVVPGMEEAQRHDLRWLGLDWDEGPDVGGPHAPYRQSERTHLYAAALGRLAAAGRLFPCTRSRQDLRSLASAPHGAAGEPPYPKAFRPPELPSGWFAAEPRDAALRFRVEEAAVAFTDRVFGSIEERVGETVGDFVLRRRDGLHAYQLAVVVDDLAMAIDDVVRGADLLASTARQIQLLEALGGVAPAYAHVPLIVDAAGEKLSKRDRALSLATLRTAGIRPQALVGYLAFSLGLLPAPSPCAPADLIPLFSWRALGREAWPLPSALPALLQQLR